MSIPETDASRRIIPRWRESSLLVTSREADALKEGAASVARRDFLVESGIAYLEQKKIEWRTHGTLPHANDLIASAFVLSRPELAVDAAQQVLEREAETSSQARQIARLVLGESNEGTANHDGVDTLFGPDDRARRSVRGIRQMVRRMPRNPLAWIDLARHYSTLGLNDQAKRAMRVGVALAPDFRFAIRSAARLYVHLEEPDSALAIIRDSPGTSTDPWLMASEIAVARVAGRSPQMLRQGRQVLSQGDFSDFHLSELASAIGSIELENGNDRRARQFLTRSLLEPNDNVVAQAEWASRRLPSGILEPRHLELPNTFEART